MSPLIIAIDGPSGAGKGTIARAVAGRLHYRHIDTGAMYRALAWKALDESLDLGRGRARLFRPTRALSRPATGASASTGTTSRPRSARRRSTAPPAIVARQPRVREALIANQRALGAQGGVVMEGRDIGTVVFPAADVKIYLDASPEERARRRANDSAHALGQGAAIGDVATALEERDRSDRTRAASPLRWPPTPSSSTRRRCRSTMPSEKAMEA